MVSKQQGGQNSGQGTGVKEKKVALVRGQAVIAEDLYTLSCLEICPFQIQDLFSSSR
jgi:hypothetical protein